MTGYCYQCRTAARGAAHLSTARHARTVAGPVRRIRAGAVRRANAGIPAWRVAAYLDPYAADPREDAHYQSLCEGSAAS